MGLLTWTDMVALLVAFGLVCVAVSHADRRKI